MRKILPAGEEPDKRTALEGELIANGSEQRRIAGFQRVEYRPLGHFTFKRQHNFVIYLCQRSEMCGKRDANHDSVWTSTESTAGRSRTIGAHESPASAEAYTWPPVVPK